MESIEFSRQRGQILVQVAIMVGVLFAFVALAVDAGNVYGGRRRMQNAADAGALAGARAICFPEDGVDPETEAYDYAERNGARPEDVQVTIEDYTVIVTAAQTLDTFFAGVIGINTANVRAEAAAICGGADNAGGLWPLAFDFEAYTETLGCGQEFMVFASESSSDTVCAPYSHDYCENEIESDDPYYNTLDCSYESVGAHVSTANRGWLLFDDPEEPYELADEIKCPGVGACGSGRVACWLANDYPGDISKGDCISGQPGVADSVKDEVDSRAGDLSIFDDGDIVSIVLWDETECELDPDDKCKKTPYYVKDFGCIMVVGWEQSAKIPTCGGSPKHKNAHLVRAVKICESTNPDEYTECSASVGSTSGGLPEDWELRTVSLIPVPSSGSP